MTFLVVQSFGPRGAWPGAAALALKIGSPVEVIDRHLLELEAAGWVERTRTVDADGLVCKVGARGVPLASIVPPGADAPDPKPARARAARRPKIQRAEHPADVRALASELFETYPHGHMEPDASGRARERRPTRATVEDLLVALVQGKTPAERERAFDAVRAGCKAEASTPGDRRFQKGLDVWLRQHGWADRPVARRVARAPGEETHGFRPARPDELRGGDGWAPAPKVDGAATRLAPRADGAS